MRVVQDFLDVDFENIMPEGRLTGALPRASKPGDGRFPLASSRFEAIPRSMWKEKIESHKPLTPLVGKIKDQNGEGSCAGNAAVKCGEIVWNFQLGMKRQVELSAMSLYKRTGSGPNSGSNIDSNLTEFMNRGVLPVDNARNRELFKHVHPAIGWRHRLPEGWTSTAAFFVVVEWLDITTYDELITALLLNMPVCYGRSGHAICGVDPVWHNNSAVVKYANSWHESWGDEGFGYDSERAIGGYIRSYGAWACRTVRFPAWAYAQPDAWVVA